jgi:hypothetical protein
MRPTLTGGRAQPPGLPLVLIGLVFVVSRLAVLPLPPLASDVGIYTAYAREQAAAARRGVSFYTYHAREVERQAEEARATGTLVAPIDEYKDVEYPPLTLVVMWLPALGHGTEGGTADGPVGGAYRRAFRAGMAVVDVVLFALLLFLVGRFFPAEDRRQRGQRLLMYVACTLVLGPLLYDRLDLLLAALVVSSLALLTGRRHYGWSFAVLAGAILFKVVPAVLAPLWAVGAMSADRPLDLRRPRVLAGLGGHSALLLVLVVAGFLPSYLRDGSPCLGFLAYHRARPLEVGSLAASVPLALWLLGHPLALTYSYGSINVLSPLTPALAALSPWLTAGALLAAALLLLIHFHRLSLQPGDVTPRRVTLAALHPPALVEYALLMMMLFIATGKVFSTQYLLWLVPLVVLLPPGPAGRGAFAWTFLLVCLLSTVLVPFLFVSDLLDPAPPQTVPRAVKAPTVRLAALLLGRNLLFLGLVVALAARLVRGAFPRSAGGGRAAA